MATLRFGAGGRGAFRASVRKQLFDMRQMSARLSQVNGKTLTLVGLDVRDAAKRGIGQDAPAKTKAGAKAVGADRLIDIDGGVYRDRSAVGRGKPRLPGKPIKSWAPKRFVYRDIVSSLDLLSGSVVIGPYKSPWLNQLHQFGGLVRQTAYVIGRNAARYAFDARRRAGKVPVDFQGRRWAGAVMWTNRSPGQSWDAAGRTRVANYPARPFMAGSAQVDRAMEKANRWFRDTFYPRRAA